MGGHDFPDSACPVCGGEASAGGRGAFDDRYGHPGAFRIAACAACGHLMTEPRLQESELPALYGNYYPRRHLSARDVAREARGATGRWRAFLRWLSGTDNQGQYRARAGERMLDVGCGAGVSLLEAGALGATAYGVEADPNVQRIAAELGLRIHQGSLHDHPFPDVDFHLIVLNQVIEHIPRPDLALAGLRGQLAPGGRVVLVFPNRRSLWCRLSGARWINWHVPYHLHHFDAASFRRMALRCGYTVAGIRSITPNLWTLLQLRAMRSRPVRGVASALWRVPAEGGGDAGPATRAWSARAALLSGILLLALPNRVVDAFGCGDSLMVELRPAGPA